MKKQKPEDRDQRTEVGAVETEQTPLPSDKPSKRKTAYEQRRLAFAHAFCRLGKGVAAYRECFPASRMWKDTSICNEAARLLRDPIVKNEITRIQTDSQLDAIASRQEIAILLVDIMRGTKTETRVVGERIVEVPGSFSTRMRAAKELERMLPAVSPEQPTGQQRDRSDDKLADTLAMIRKRNQKTAG